MNPLFTASATTLNSGFIENKILQLDSLISITVLKNESHLLFNCPHMKKAEMKNPSLPAH